MASNTKIGAQGSCSQSQVSGQSAAVGSLEDVKPLCNSLGQNVDTTLKCLFIPGEEKILFHVKKIYTVFVALFTATFEATTNSSLHPQDSTYTHTNTGSCMALQKAKGFAN